MMREVEFLWVQEVRREELELEELEEEVQPGVIRDQHSPEIYIEPAGSRESAQVKISQLHENFEISRDLYQSQAEGGNTRGRRGTPTPRWLR